MLKKKKNKKTLHNIMNKLEDSMSDMSQPINLTEDEIDCGMQDVYGHDTSLEDAGDEFRKMKALIGGNYGTNDTDVYGTIAGVIDMAREGKMWQAYAWWLVEELAEIKGKELEDHYFHLFLKHYDEYQRWDRG